MILLIISITTKKKIQTNTMSEVPPQPEQDEQLTEASEAARRILGSNNFDDMFSDKGGPYAPGEPHLRPTFQLPDELRIRDERIAELENEVRMDPLTGLYNKAAWLKAVDERLAQLETDARAGVVFIDLKDFKAINDKHPGLHEKGDEVLRDVAECLRKSTRQMGELSDVVAHGSREDTGSTARLGGDEFAILVDLRGTTGESPEEKLTRLTNRLQSIFNEYLEGHPDLTLAGFGGISVGAVLNQPGDTAVTMLARADELMRAHKDQQREEHSGYR